MVNERFMRMAIRLARKGAGRTRPNPAVGAVIVKKNRIVSRGYHKRAGAAHGEAVALGSATPGVLKGATLYVTLEPCCHRGRTPPCTDAIKGSGIRSVVIGSVDPNPMVSGSGIKALKRAGIEVVTGVLADECRAINDWYFKYITTKTPFVTLKLASSLDGKIATAEGQSRWITGLKSRGLVHRMRSGVDAVMVGVGTVLKDDPRLTVRLARGPDPARVVLDSGLRIPLKAKVFDNLGEGGKGGEGRGGGGRLIIFTTGRAPKDKIKRVLETGAELRVLPATKNGVGIKRALKELGKMGISTLLIEGGSRVAASALGRGAVDKLAIFFSPMILGRDALASVGELGVKGLSMAPRIKRMTVRRIGDDLLVEGYL